MKVSAKRVAGEWLSWEYVFDENGDLICFQMAAFGILHVFLCILKTPSQHNQSAALNSSLLTSVSCPNEPPGKLMTATT